MAIFSSGGNGARGLGLELMNRHMENSAGLRNKREMGQAGGMEDSLWKTLGEFL